MNVGEPVLNQETGELEVDLYKVTRSEVKWLREAVWHHQDDIDLDDLKKAGTGKKLLEKIQQAVDKMRPPER